MTSHRFRARPWFAVLMAVALVSCDSSSTEPPPGEDPDPSSPPSITTTSLPSGQVNEPYAVTLEAVDGDGTFTWAIAAGGLPDGLSLTEASGTISGTPTTEGTFDFTAEVTSDGQSDTRDLSVEVVAAGGEVFSTVVNVDWDADATDAYVGDDAVYSTSGATYWNPWSSSSLGSPVTDLADEFSATTAVDVFTDISGLSFIGAANNEMQNEGIWDSDPTDDVRIEWRDLESDGVYDLAFYVYAEAALGAFTALDVIHSGGTTTLENTEPTWILPGEDGKDYVQVQDVSPIELEPGIWGFIITNVHGNEDFQGGVVMGMQLRGPVRTP